MNLNVLLLFVGVFLVLVLALITVGAALTWHLDSDYEEYLDEPHN